MAEVWQQVTPRRRRRSGSSGAISTPSKSPSGSQQIDAMLTNSPFHVLEQQQPLLAKTSSSTSVAKIPEVARNMSEKGPKSARKSQPTTPAKRSSVQALPQSPVVDLSRREGSFDKALDLRKLREIQSEFQARYPSRHELHLQALADAVDVMLGQTGVLLKPFGSRSFTLTQEWLGGIYASLPRLFREWVETLMEQQPAAALESFLTTSIVFLIDQQKSAGGSLMMRDGLGQQIFIQASLKNERAKLNMGKVVGDVLKHFANFQANPAIGHTLFWVLSQAPAHPMDVVVWLQYLLPCFGQNATSSAATVQSVALDYMDQWMDAVDLLPQAVMKPFVVSWELFEPLLLVSFSSNSVLLESKKGLEYIPRLQKVFRYLRERFVHPRSLLTLDFDDAFRHVLPMLTTKDEILSAELKNFTLLTLCRAPSGFKVLWKKYPTCISQTLALLQSLDDRWVDVRTKLVQVELQYTLGRIKSQNIEWLDSFKNSAADKAKVSKQTLRDINSTIESLEGHYKSTSGVTLKYLVLFFVFLAIFLPVYCDATAKRSDLFLAPNGPICRGYQEIRQQPVVKQGLEYVPTSWEQVGTARKNAQEWIVTRSQELVKQYPQLTGVRSILLAVHDTVKDTYLEYAPRVKQSLGDFQTRLNEEWFPALALAMDKLKERVTSFAK